MGVTAARKARSITTNVEFILAIEYLCATQAREFHAELRPGRGALAAYELLRSRVAPLDRDRYLKDDIDVVHELIVSGGLLRAVEYAVGALHA